MYSWRVTKYDPLNRDADGGCLDHHEWTCFSEVGTKISTEKYQVIEGKYLNAITIFMAEMGLNRVYVTVLEQWSDEECSILNKIQLGQISVLPLVKDNPEMLKYLRWTVLYGLATRKHIKDSIENKYEQNKVAYYQAYKESHANRFCR